MPWRFRILAMFQTSAAIRQPHRSKATEGVIDAVGAIAGSFAGHRLL
jgi:hypothetical protein